MIATAKIRLLRRRTAAGRGFGLLALTTVALAGCDENFADPGQVRQASTTLTAVSGTGQIGFVGEPLRLPLRVQVRDARGNPAPQQRVDFRVLVGEGEFVSTSGVTDFAGFTQVTLVPRSEGELVVEASPSGGAARADFTVTAIDRSRLENPALFEIVGGDGQTGTVGSVLPLPLTVRVANEFGTPLARFPVIFTATTPGTLLLTANQGDFTESDSLGNTPAPSDSVGRQVVSFTNQDGLAGVLVRLATRPGGNEVTASSTAATGASTPLVFTATGEAGGPSSAQSIIKIAGDEQNVSIDTTGIGFTPSITFNPMVVQVTDAFGNPVPGVTVFFRLSVGFGTLSTTVAVTDSNGFAETIYTSNEGSSGGVAVSATAPGVGTVLFTAEITAEGGEPDDGGDGGDGGGGGG